MEENPYEAPKVPSEPGRRINWFYVALLPYALAAMATELYVDGLTADTKYNNAAGGAVLWAFILGGVVFWLALRARSVN
jgi:hypothetical protein